MKLSAFIIRCIFRCGDKINFKLMSLLIKLIVQIKQPAVAEKAQALNNV